MTKVFNAKEREISILVVGLVVGSDVPGLKVRESLNVKDLLILRV